MKTNIIILILGFCFISLDSTLSQCAQSISINSASATCNGDGTSTVTVNLTIIFGNGNNSAVVTYDIGNGAVDALILEDDNGDIINQTYMFTVPTCNDFSITLTAWTNPAGSGRACTNPPPVTQQIMVQALPVVFGKLNAKVTSEGVLLHWETFTEINNDRFEILRSSDNVKYEKIQSIVSEGDSYVKRDYYFEDSHPLQGSNFYKIKQVDLDNSNSYSKVVQIQNMTLENINIFPNPASSYFNVTTPQRKITIQSLDGGLMKTIEQKEPKSYFEIANLPNGVYLIHFDNESKPVKLLIYN